MTVMPDHLDDSCWPVDDEACEEFATFEEPIKEMAKALAAQSMRALTGYAVGGCPGTLRPCSVRCAAGSAHWHWSNGTFMPVNVAGTWINATCGCGWDCSHDGVQAITLPGWVASVQQVKIDGEVLDPTAYRVDDHRELVRTDGEPWPSGQNMGLPDSEVGTFSVTYMTGIEVDAVGARAAGLLACEFAKALAGKTCELPKSVVTVVRQGITLTKTPGVFPDGLTGNLVVDAYTLRYNPYRSKQQSAVWSPDTAGGRQTTWTAP